MAAFKTYWQKQKKIVIILTQLTENIEEEIHEKVPALRLHHNDCK